MEIRLNKELFSLFSWYWAAQTYQPRTGAGKKHVTHNQKKKQGKRKRYELLYYTHTQCCHQLRKKVAFILLDVLYSQVHGPSLKIIEPQLATVLISHDLSIISFLIYCVQLFTTPQQQNQKQLSITTLRVLAAI